MSRTHREARQLVRAHQYLYYVMAKPIWSDREYDEFCKKWQIDGGGGSDRASDYSKPEIALAEKIRDAAP